MRVVTDGTGFRVQRRFLFFFWVWEMRPENLGEKDFGGPVWFEFVGDAKRYVSSREKIKWTVVK